MFENFNVLSFREKTPESRDPSYEMTIHNNQHHPGAAGDVNRGYESPKHTPNGQNLEYSYATVEDNPRMTHSYTPLQASARHGGHNFEYSYATAEGALTHQNIDDARLHVHIRIYRRRR